MADVVHPKKALAVNPLKASQPIGASLAFLGLARSMPLEHGARGCTSFNKLFFMRHFHDPIALQTTAMDQITTVLGADDNVVSALATIAERDGPEVIGLITTGLSEMQGADVPRTIAAFRQAYPQLAAMAVVPVSASDTKGCLESGYAAALEAIVETLVPAAWSPLHKPNEGRTPSAGEARQVTVLLPAFCTPGDVEAVREWVEAFGVVPVMLPDLGDSLDGHLIPQGFSTLTYGGTPRAAFERLKDSLATVVIGRSLEGVAALLQERTGVPTHHIPDVMTLAGCDAFSRVLADVAARPVPASVLRWRDRLTDAMVDCQFQLSGARVAIAADPDHVAALVAGLQGLGAEVVAVVASAPAPFLADVPVEQVVIGDLEDLEWLARQHQADLVITNAHGVDLARRIGAALLRAGFPIYDEYGAHAKAWVGYRGLRERIHELANLLNAHFQEIRPYRSRFWVGTPRAAEQAAE